MKSLKTILLLVSLICYSCIKTPTNPIQDQTLPQGEFSLILCEGLNGYNNAEINVFESETGILHENIFEQINKFPLGDIANDIQISEDYLFIVVSASKVVYKIDLKSWKVIGQLHFEGNHFPRKLILDDGFGYLTDAYSSQLYKIEMNSMKIVDSLKVGPQPEGLASFLHAIYVLNSGWGDINKDADGASTISVIDKNTFSVMKSIKTGQNPVEIQIDYKNNFLYVVYYNLPSLKDSLGGIIKYDLSEINKLQEWRGNFSEMKLSYSGDTIYTLKGGFQQKQKNEQSSIQLIDLARGTIKTLIKNDNSFEKWYNFALDCKRNYLWIANAKNFQTKGEIKIFDLDNSNPIIIKNLTTGINPNKIILNLNSN